MPFRLSDYWIHLVFMFLELYLGKLTHSLAGVEYNIGIPYYSSYGFVGYGLTPTLICLCASLCIFIALLYTLL